MDTIARSQSNSCLAYFYCARNYAENERSDPAQLLRSIVRQMSLDNGRLHKLVTNIYTKREEEGFLRGPLRLEESVELIIQLANRENAIVIDALDECDPTVRHRLLSGLTRVIKEAPGLVKVFISS